MLRETYLPAKFCNRPSALKVTVLYADTRLSFPLAIYISKAFELLRGKSISNAILAWSAIVSHMLCIVVHFYLSLLISACKRAPVCVCVCVCGESLVERSDYL